MNKHIISPLHLITHGDTPGQHIQQVEYALQAGIDWIQLRMKTLSPAVRSRTAMQIMEMCRHMPVRIIINDDPILALNCGAHGVHLGHQDMAVQSARQILGPEAIIGSTANTFLDIEKLYAEGTDYIGLGPYRFTRTKNRLRPVLGVTGYREIMAQCHAKAIPLPVIAIGGITIDDVELLMNTTIHGIAVSGGINQADDPITAAQQFIEKTDKGHMNKSHNTLPTL